MSSSSSDKDNIRAINGEVLPVSSKVLTEKEQLLNRLQELLDAEDSDIEDIEDEELEPYTGRSVATLRDDFSFAARPDEEPELEEMRAEDILIRVSERLQQEEPGEEFHRAILALVGGAMGAQLGGPTGAGIGAALSSLLYSRKVVNPLAVLGIIKERPVEEERERQEGEL